MILSFQQNIPFCLSISYFANLMVGKKYHTISLLLFHLDLDEKSM